MTLLCPTQKHTNTTFHPAEAAAAAAARPRGRSPYSAAVDERRLGSAPSAAPSDTVELWCRLTWRSRLLLRLQEKEQWRHACGLTPVWIHRWRRREARQVKYRPHAWHKGAAWAAWLSSPLLTPPDPCNDTVLSARLQHSGGCTQHPHSPLALHSSHTSTGKVTYTHKNKFRK